MGATLARVQLSMNLKFNLVVMTVISYSKPRADGSVLTVLIQDKEVEGLLFQKDDQWSKF